jgi:outer membrane biosynthesis protein TonB
MFVLSYSITMPTKEEFKNPETYFVKVETDEIHKPVKPVPKPKPVAPAPIPAPEKAERKELAKTTPKETPKTAVRESVASKPDTRVASSTESSRPAGEKTGNVENRNVKQVGLLGALGMKTGVSLKPNEALASVSNIDAVSSSHANEALVKVGGIKGSLGGGKVSIASGPVINNKSAADVYRSAGIGGKGTVGAIASGNTGKRAVKAVVSAPVAKRVNASGGGITREDVAKVINEHFSEIQNCYDTAVMNDPTLMGRIEFEWTILLSGEVADVKIKSSTIRSSQLHACITATIRSWKFPKPQGASVVVSYPFVFDVTGF